MQNSTTICGFNLSVNSLPLDEQRTELFRLLRLSQGMCLNVRWCVSALLDDSIPEPASTAIIKIQKTTEQEIKPRVSYCFAHLSTRHLNPPVNGRFIRLDKKSDLI